MESIRSDSRTARLLAEAAGDSVFTLIDVGCSGGIDSGWNVFGDRLRCFAFDPSLYEIQRLTAAETRPMVHYVNGFVGLPEGHPSKGASIEPWRLDPWGRLSCYRTQSLQQAAAAQATEAVTADPGAAPEPAAAAAAPSPAPVADDADLDLMQRNLWHQARLADPDAPIVLPDFLAAAGVSDVDFIKIDVDGADFEILQSLQATLDDPTVLGATLEVSFHGSASPHDNTFHNMDRFMRARGFDLLDLTVRKYSLAAMPRPYLASHPFAAQTTGGRPFQGDAVYLRDLNHRRLQPPPQLDTDKLLKLAALYALFGLLDHAAEILILHRDRLSARLDVDQVLNVIAAESQDMDADLWEGRRFADYAALMTAFEADDPIFYDAWDRRARHQAKLSQDSATAASLADQVVALRAQADAGRAEAARVAAEAEARIAEAEASRAAAQGEVEAMRRTLSWRVTAGLRALRRRR